MIPSRKGVISMPIKLMVAFLMIALMVPTVISTVDSINESIEDNSIIDSAYELRSLMSKVNSRGPNFILQAELSIPEGGYLVIGEGIGRSISVYWEDRYVDDILLDFTIQGDRTVFEGDVLLKMTNGTEGVVVKEL